MITSIYSKLMQSFRFFWILYFPCQSSPLYERYV